MEKIEAKQKEKKKKKAKESGKVASDNDSDIGEE